MNDASNFGCMVEIQQTDDEIFSVKIDGKEMSQHICGLQLSVSDKNPTPILSVDLVVEGVKLSSKALLSIPEPYGSFIQYKRKEKHAD